MEEMLIARARPIMTIYRKHGGQRGYRGHVLNLPQNIEQFIKTLPVSVSALPILLVKQKGVDNTEPQFRVRRSKVLDALLWLKANNTFYSDIDINHECISTLPENGIPSGIQQLEADDCDSTETTDLGPPIVTDDTGVATEFQDQHLIQKKLIPIHSYLSLKVFKQRKLASIAGCDPLDWPQLGERGINEYSTEGLATQTFPTLFPYGKILHLNNAIMQFL